MEKSEFIELMEEVFEREEGTVSLDDSFRDYDEWDSMTQLALNAELNGEYDITISKNDFEEIITLNDLYEYIKTKVD